MAEKKKGFNLAEALGAVSDLDTGAAGNREQIEYIDIDRLDDDPNNFYDLSSLDELASNIELFGLQQPLRVRVNPDDPSRYIIVSGHRRRAAIRKLVDAGRTDLREIPCIRERIDGSPAFQELRLIYANSDTRRMTSAEISRQAERVEMLLYELKKEGYEFPGRMRDHVAEAVKVSKTKLARLKVIREGLVPELKAVWESGEMNEAVAYACAQQSVDMQRWLIQYSATCQYYTTPDHWYEATVKSRVETLEAEDSLVCRRQAGGGKCDNIEKRLALLASNRGRYDDNCYKGKCCSGCPRIGTCKYACDRLSGEIKAAKESRKEQLRKEKAEKEKRARPLVQEISDLWNRFGLARGMADKSVEECKKALGLYYVSSDDDKYLKLECLETKITETTDTPFGWFLTAENVRSLNRLADLLGCSVDYLLCRTDVPQVATAPAAPTEDPCALCKSSHPECDACCSACQVPCNSMQLCRKAGESFKATENPFLGPTNDGTAPAAPVGQTVFAGWMPEGTTPGPEPGLCVAMFTTDGLSPWRTLCWWDGSGFNIGKGGVHISERCIQWMRLPPDPPELEEEDNEDA